MASLAIQRGETVLIGAGSGGVGHFAVQIAASLGATVIASASSGKADFVRRLGANHVVEHGRSGLAVAADVRKRQTPTKRMAKGDDDSMHGSLLGPEHSDAEIEATLKSHGAVYRRMDGEAQRKVIVS